MNKKQRKTYLQLRKLIDQRLVKIVNQIVDFYDSTDTIPPEGFHIKKSDEDFLVWVIENNYADEYISAALYCLRKLDRPQYLKIYQRVLVRAVFVKRHASMYEAILVLKDIGENLPFQSLGCNDYQEMVSIAMKYISEKKIIDEMIKGK